MVEELKTLPDLLKPGLRLVFVGINPGSYSARRGHYYAGPGNLFWWALNESGLVDRPVGPEDDASLTGLGIGFTDVVKRPSSSASDLNRQELKKGAEELLKKLQSYKPCLVCFNGLTGYAHCFGGKVRPGLQKTALGDSKIYVVPSTSRRNAQYQRDQVLRWFKGLRACLDQLKYESMTQADGGAG